MPSTAPHPRPFRLSAGLAHLATPLAAFYLNMLALGVPVAVLHIYDRIIPSQTSQTLATLLAALLGIVLLDAALRAARAVLLTGADAQREHAARQAIAGNLLGAHPAALRALPSAAATEAMAAAHTLKEAAAQRQQVAVDLPFALLFLALIGMIGETLVLVSLAGVILFALIAWRTGRAQGAAANRLRAAMQQREQMLHGIFANLPTSKLLMAELPLLSRFRQLQEAHASALRGVVQHAAFLREIGLMFSQLQVALMIGVGALLVLDGRLSTGGLAACTLLSGRALQPLQSALGLVQGWHETRAARSAQARLQALACETIGAGSEEFAEMPSLTLQGLQINGPNGRPLLQAAALEIPAGAMAAIRPGRQGEASALLGALLGLVEAQAGEIRVGGAPLGPHNAPAIRRNTALVSRETVLMEGTLMQNLTEFGDAERQAEVQYLCFLLGLDTAIKRLPEGYEMRLDRHGRGLPPNIRQNVGLVRALSARPRLLLLDEAEAALDPAAQLRLASFLRRLKGRVTMVVVTSSAPLAGLADQSWQVEAGRLVSAGVEAAA